MYYLRVEAGDQHEQVCIPPGSNGEYSVAYNTARLPVENQAVVQDIVLGTIITQFTNLFTEGPDDFCSGENTYSAVTGHNIDLFGYVYCGQGVVDGLGCTDCLNRGAQVIMRNCPDSCYGAQASSENRCIRFEGVDFLPS
ncbi:hypothetical protein LINGRAHAP2_LOCUS12162 [Linum grandiflorum]